MPVVSEKGIHNLFPGRDRLLPGKVLELYGWNVFSDFVPVAADPPFLFKTLKEWRPRLCPSEEYPGKIHLGFFHFPYELFGIILGVGIQAEYGGGDDRKIMVVKFGDDLLVIKPDVMVLSYWFSPSSSTDSNPINTARHSERYINSINSGCVASAVVDWHPHLNL